MYNSNNPRIPGGSNPIYDRSTPQSLPNSPGNQNYAQRPSFSFQPTTCYRPPRDRAWVSPYIDNSLNVRPPMMVSHNNQPNYHHRLPANGSQQPQVSIKLLCFLLIKYEYNVGT